MCCACKYICVRVHTCHYAQAEVRGQHGGIGSLFLAHRGLNLSQHLAVDVLTHGVKCVCTCAHVHTHTYTPV